MTYILLLECDNTPLASFNADPSIDLWLSAKGRRPSQKKMKEYAPRRSDHQSTSQAQDDSSEDSEPEDMLGCWDKMMSSKVTVIVNNI